MIETAMAAAIITLSLAAAYALVARTPKSCPSAPHKAFEGACIVRHDGAWRIMIVCTSRMVGRYATYEDAARI